MTPHASGMSEGAEELLDVNAVLLKYAVLHVDKEGKQERLKGCVVQANLLLEN